ncbi:exonuclease [Yangia mangrovi]|uniref:Exonuclease n=1 Tax=Alloyangia mangrovi TaxID=1779329 RepID=A0ABT2KT42_9RHOB|nr:exonuclease domain-containing protein [Alloyangia mangrovi]MCT4373346.1 exonuclease [Alloyangia mangrovi]
MVKKLLSGASPAAAGLAAIRQKSFRFVAVDVETANSDAGSIYQIGLACVGDRGVEEVVTLLIDPQCPFDGMNVRVHGITAEQVSGEPTFAAFLDTLGDFLERHLLVQHSSFDSRAIRCATETCGRLPQALKWHDSVKVARLAWPEFKGNGGHGLAHLKTALGLNFRHHDAGEDARAAAEVVLMAEARLQKPFPEILAPRPGGRVPRRAAV